MVENRAVRQMVKSYLDNRPEDQEYLQRLNTLLTNIIDVTRPGKRDHVVASVVVFNDKGLVLLVDGTLPGGPLKRDDATMTDAALRHLCATAGMPADAVVPLSSVPVHVHACEAPVAAKLTRVISDCFFVFLVRSTIPAQAAHAQWVAPGWLRDPVLVDRVHDLGTACEQELVVETRQSRVLSAAAIEWAVEQYADGRGPSIQMLATSCDVSYGTMRSALLRAGATLRQHGGDRFGCACGR